MTSNSGDANKVRPQRPSGSQPGGLWSVPDTGLLAHSPGSRTREDARQCAAGWVISGGCVTLTLFLSCMQSCMLIGMQSTSVRIDQATHQELKRLADRLGTTVGETVALAVRRLRQDRIGEELTATLSRNEVDWLDADLG